MTKTTTPNARWLSELVERYHPPQLRVGAIAKATGLSYYTLNRAIFHGYGSPRTERALAKWREKIEKQFPMAEKEADNEGARSEGA